MTVFHGPLDLLQIAGSVTPTRPHPKRHDWRWFRRYTPLLPLALAAGMLAGMALALITGEGL